MTLHKQPRLRCVPCTWKQACEFVEKHHRHHKAPQGYKFAIGAADPNGELRGVVLCGRPVSRHQDDGRTVEAIRVATDGCPNACSFLYGAAWRAAKALGYDRLITYILQSEPATSLRAAGWYCVGMRQGGSWHRCSRPRSDKHPTVQKMLWQSEVPT